MRILFLHGWQSTPGGVKPTYLKDHGHEVLNPALPDDDLDAAVKIAQAEFDRHRPDVVVGSSRGEAVAMNILSDEAHPFAHLTALAMLVGVTVTANVWGEGRQKPCSWR